MNKFLNDFKKGISIALGFLFMIFLTGISYAVWTGLNAELGDSLTAAKWNELVDKVETLEANVGSGSLGIGQTWQDVTSSRISGKDYINDTGKTIIVSLVSNTKSGYPNTASLYVDNVKVSQGGENSVNTTVYFSIFAVVPPNSIYRADVVSSILSWTELRLN